MKNSVHYTLVQHSGFVGGGDPLFSQAVESKLITSKRELRTVATAGGMKFGSYLEADAAELKENYPPEIKGLIPQVRGSFAKQKIDGQPIYKPAKGTTKRT